MSNHFTGLSLGPPLGDQRLDLCDLYAFQSPADPARREEAIAAIDAEGLLPDMLAFDPSRPAEYPNGRSFTDDVINHRLSFLTKGDAPPTGLKPHTDTLGEFPYLGNPHPKAA